MICERCGTETVTWRGPLVALTHTECSRCGGINCQRVGKEPEQEGEPCPSCGEPVVTEHPGDGCSCHISPPCSYCVDTWFACRACGWEGEQP